MEKEDLERKIARLESTVRGFKKKMAKAFYFKDGAYIPALSVKHQRKKRTAKNLQELMEQHIDETKLPETER